MHAGEIVKGVFEAHDSKPTAPTGTRLKGQSHPGDRIGLPVIGEGMARRFVSGRRTGDASRQGVGYLATSRVRVICRKEFLLDDRRRCWRIPQGSTL